MIDELVVDRKLPAGGTKRDSTVELVNGGAAVNVARQARMLGADVREILFLGDDDSSLLARPLARREFPESMPVRALEHTRLSIWLGNDAHVVRSRLKIDRVPVAARWLLKQTSFVVVAPMTSADAPVIRDILGLSQRCVLQLSAQQLIRRKTANELACKAWMVAVNDSELGLWTGNRDIATSLEIVRGYGVHRLIVTCADGATGFVNEAPFQVPGFGVRRVRQTRGAGDVSLATTVVGLRDGLAWLDAVRLGQAAAAFYVAGDKARYGHRGHLSALIEKESRG